MAADVGSGQDIYAVKLARVGRCAVQVAGRRAGGGDDATVGDEVGGQIGGCQDAVDFVGYAGPRQQVPIRQTQNAQDGVGVEGIGAGDVLAGIAHSVAVV